MKKLLKAMYTSPWGPPILFAVLLILLLVRCESSDPGLLVPSDEVFVMPGCEELKLRDPEADC